MTPLKRSRRLQAGLAGLSVVSALGAAVGLGLTTHTHNSAQSGSAGSDGHGATRSVSHRGELGDDGGAGDDEGSRHAATSQQSSPVTQPSSNPPQATTSGS